MKICLDYFPRLARPLLVISEMNWVWMMAGWLAYAVKTKTQQNRTGQNEAVA